MIGVGAVVLGGLAGWWWLNRPAGAPATYLRHQAPQLLMFDELQALAANPTPTGPLQAKYEALWTTPLVSNAAHEAGVRPHAPSSPELGPFLRVATWNIEKSLHLDEAIAVFTDPQSFALQMDPTKAPPGSPTFLQAMAERELLAQADVILLQEMDLGVKRSGYRDAARELAEALQMNYAYLPEYLEIDPVLLGMETIRFEEGQEDVEATAHYAVDPERYKGLFGCAVLSRYPIIYVEGRRLQAQGYDWYWGEHRHTTFLEKLRRFGAETVFLETQHREMKKGGRTYFRVDLEVPELPERRLTVINVHLEIKCTPQMRAAQMREILSYIKDIRHPVILAGDFNSAPQDLSPTSAPRVVWRQVKTPEFWLSRIIEYSSPYALAINTARFLSNVTKNYQNPTAPDIPLLAPNRVKPLFRQIEQFRFADGGAFDFRGDPARSAGDHGLLSNSNERDLWAYATTFRVERTVANLIGKYRLDWIFVKVQPGSYRFAPHFGRTLSAINDSVVERISDHDPNIVDLPFGEPPLQP